MRWFFVPVRDDEGKVIGYFERHKCTGISATPVSLLRCRSRKQDIKTKQAAHRV